MITLSDVASYGLSFVMQLTVADDKVAGNDGVRLAWKLRGGGPAQAYCRSSPHVRDVSRQIIVASSYLARDYGVSRC